MRAEWAHVQWFLHNPLTDYERLFLRRTRFFAWKRIRYALFLLAMAVSLTPLWLYLDTNQTGLLLVMVAVIYLAHVMVEMRTMLLAIHSITREQRAGTWDLLILTGIDARRIVWGKWWGVVRHVWKDHALMALPRVGLAFGIAQYLLRFPPASMYQPFPWGTPFAYVSCLPNCSNINPQLTTTLIGALLILIFSAVEAGLMGAIGIALACCSRHYHVLQVLAGTAVRIVITVVAILVIEVGRVNWQHLLVIHCSLSPSCAWHGAGIPSDEASYYELNSIRRTVLRIKDTAQLSVSPLTDAGTSLSANVMRPFGDGTMFGKDIRLIKGEWVILSHSNLLFVLRNLVAAILGLTLYALIIVGVLRLAQAAVQRHGALRP